MEFLEIDSLTGSGIVLWSPLIWFLTELWIDTDL
jgi:hypothetical protein